MVERFRDQLTTEQLCTRLDRILRDREGDPAPGEAVKFLTLSYRAIGDLPLRGIP